jgi:hypothetical protein
LVFESCAGHAVLVLLPPILAAEGDEVAHLDGSGPSGGDDVPPQTMARVKVRTFDAVKGCWPAILCGMLGHFAEPDTLLGVKPTQGVNA